MRSMMSFATGITRRTMQSRWEREVGYGVEDNELAGVPIRDVPGGHRIAKASFRQVGAVIASRRLDNARELSAHLAIDEAGEPYIDAELMPLEPSTPTRELSVEEKKKGFVPVSSDKRQGCPALYVQGGLDLAGDTLDAAVTQAQKELLSEQYISSLRWRR